MTTAFHRAPSARRCAFSRLSTGLAALVTVLAACGGGSGSTSQGGAGGRGGGSAPVQPNSVLRLYESATVHASLTASGLVHATIDYVVWSNGPCVFNSGSLQASLDGAPIQAGAVLPLGSHTLEVAFSQCLVDGLVGSSLDGTTSAVYTSVNLNDLTAAVSARMVRGSLLAFRSDLFDATADGSATWTRVRSSSSETVTYTPAVGSRLINNLTNRSATFGGGSHSRTYYYMPPPGFAASERQEFNDLVLVIGGTGYVLTGSLQSHYGFSAGSTSHSGEVRIASQGNVAARIYGDASGVFRTEVLSPLAPF